MSRHLPWRTVESQVAMMPSRQKKNSHPLPLSLSAPFISLILLLHLCFHTSLFVSCLFSLLSFVYNRFYRSFILLYFLSLWTCLRLSSELWLSMTSWQSRVIILNPVHQNLSQCQRVKESFTVQSVHVWLHPPVLQMENSYIIIFPSPYYGFCKGDGIELKGFERIHFCLSVFFRSYSALSFFVHSQILHKNEKSLLRVESVRRCLKKGKNSSQNPRLRSYHVFVGMVFGSVCSLLLFLIL